MFQEMMRIMWTRELFSILEEIKEEYRLTRRSWSVQAENQFLANVNSRSRSLYAIARPSVCRLSVCL